MRIAFILEAFPVLSETFILNQVSGLIDRGHHVDIYASQVRDTSVSHPDVERYDLCNRMRCRPRMPAGKIRRSIKGVGLILVSGPRHPVKIARSLDIFHYGIRALSLDLLYSTVGLLRSSPYDIIHCHFGPKGITGHYLRCIGGTSAKLVTTFHGIDVLHFVRRHGRDVYRGLFDHAEAILPISKYMRDQLIDLGCSADKVVVHHMGVDCRRFDFAPPHLPTENRVRVVALGRLVEKKGVEFGIQAIKKVQNMGKDVSFDIIGDGPLKPALQQEIDRLGLSKSVKLLGRMRQEQVIARLTDAHLMLVPSVTTSDGDQEGLPVVIMEAMARGLPVVATRHTGIPEIVLDGKSGYLVPERDVDALADKLAQLIDHPETWESMGRAGRALVEEQFDIDKLNDRLVEIYQRLIDGEFDRS